MDGAVQPGRAWRVRTAWPAQWVSGRLGLLRQHWPLAPVLALAAVLFSAGLRITTYSAYYALSAHAMSLSWRAWFFGAVDRQASVSLDKTPGFLWPQAISARIFGFHPWALALPQILEGLVSVVLVYALVTGVFGRTSGLLAALAFTTTPIVAAAFGHTMEDCLLAMCVLAAALCWQRAQRSGSWLALIWCGGFVGLGFQAKMLQAWVILVPVVFATVLLGPGPVRRRLLQTAVIISTAVTASLTWAVAVVLVPANSRPFVDGTTNDNVLTMIFGYNGLGRLGVQLPGALRPARFTIAGADATVAKLFHRDLYSQYGWLLPVALLGAVFVLRKFWRERHEPDGRQQIAALTMWTLWLLTTLILFSLVSVPHTAYVLALAAPIAALCGACLPVLVAAYRRHSSGWWALPAIVLVTAVAAAATQAAFPAFPGGLAGLEILLGVGAASALVIWRSARKGMQRGALLAAAVALLMLPTAWSMSVLTAHHDGSAADASAGIGGLGRARAAALDGTPSEQAIDRSAERQRDLFSFLTAHAPGAKYPLISNAWAALVPYLLYTDGEALPTGGFSRVVPTLSQTAFTDLVGDGQARYFLADPLARTRHHTDSNGLLLLVRQRCALIHPTIGSEPLTSGRTRLYDCAGLDGR